MIYSYSFAFFLEQQQLYNNICNEHRQGCEVGDLSAKLNQSLNLASIRELPEKLFFTDELPLSGGYTIIRRSVVIHEVPVPGTPAPRLACADVLRKVICLKVPPTGMLHS